MRNQLPETVANKLRRRYTGNPNDPRFLAGFSPFDIRAASIGDRGLTQIAVFMLSRGVRPYWFAVESRRFNFGAPLDLSAVETGRQEAELEARGLYRITDFLWLPRDNAELAGIVASLDRGSVPWQLVQWDENCFFVCRISRDCREVPAEDDPAGDALADETPFTAGARV